MNWIWLTAAVILIIGALDWMILLGTNKSRRRKKE